MDQLETPILIKGVPASPYTRKMLAVLRYKHIPHRFLNQVQAEALGLPKPKIELLPTFWFPQPGGSFEPAVDSTPLIRRLENTWPHRSIVSLNPAVAFIDTLIEDFADEWLTKAMFHYRWFHAADREKSGTIIPLHADVSASQDRARMMAQSFTARQVDRLRYVGSNEVTAPVIEASYKRLLEILEAILKHRPFLFGERPGAADFAIYGQLTQLALFDPTPGDLTYRIAPRVYAWTSLVEDLSGLPDDAAFAPPDEALGVLRHLLLEVGRGYVPVLLANERAIKDGSQTVETVVDGKPWRQDRFPYHLKCLEALRAAHKALAPSDQTAVNGWLKGSGVEVLFTS
jgi:glutathione S-transferase